ncbi:Vacuolar calcium ion transporter [Escovopsis weberi]|uniref:Vacuolar calcium ion transporter n=1 Tax=Escovopsis weberi TaxID=150374 RepID=A0A0M8N7L0_ESCWE|nr:Vacuolar calcium ion transporter [Escovopsis weberi]
MFCNILWPVVPAALAVRYSLKDYHNLVFTLSYIAMVPCANLIGFAGQEFSRKFGHVFGILIETTGVALAIPTIFKYGLPDEIDADVGDRVLSISRIVSILLIIAYCVYVIFQAHSHHGIYNAVYEFEHNGHSSHPDANKEKLTMTECIVALTVSIALVTIIAITLVGEIEHIISHAKVSDAFMGLILVPLVEKFAEHLTAVDEAWDNQMNFALSNVLGATLQTALFNAPLTVIVGWGLKIHMDLDFAVFHLVMLILSILTVGRFLQDQKSNYLEGSLLVILYVAIAVSAFYFPNPPAREDHVEHSSSFRPHRGW